MMCIILFFFFQAEDGIRDKLVTGVQTCALPISGLEAVRGNVALRAVWPVFQSMTLANSTRLPAPPAERRIVWTNREASDSRSISRATRTEPFSVMRTLDGPWTKARGGFCWSVQSMFQAGQSLGFSVWNARRAGAERSSRLMVLSKMLATSPFWSTLMR